MYNTSPVLLHIPARVQKDKELLGDKCGRERWICSKMFSVFWFSSRKEMQFISLNTFIDSDVAVLTAVSNRSCYISQVSV